MPITFSPRVVRELNVLVVSCFDEGAYDGAQMRSNILSLARQTTSDSRENIYTYTSKDFSLRSRGYVEVMAEYEGVKFFEHRISNEDVYRGLEVDLNAWEDDKVDQYQSILYTLGATSAVGPSEKVEDLLAIAHTSDPKVVCYDGQPLISDAHPVRVGETTGGVWSNEIIAPLDFDSFAEAVALMRKFPREDPGTRTKTMGAKPTKLLVAPEYQQISFDICYSDKPFEKAGGGNPWKGHVEVEIIDNWHDTGLWQLHDDRLSKERAAIYQERKPLTLRPTRTNPEDPWVIENRKLRWFLDGRIAAGVGHPGRVVGGRPS
jgi:phage major head subunit gpT-like protein